MADIECHTSPEYPEKYPDGAKCAVDILCGCSGELDVQVFVLEVILGLLMGVFRQRFGFQTVSVP